MVHMYWDDCFWFHEPSTCVTIHPSIYLLILLGCAEPWAYPRRLWAQGRQSLDMIPVYHRETHTHIHTMDNWDLPLRQIPHTQWNYTPTMEVWIKCTINIKPTYIPSHILLGKNIVTGIFPGLYVAFSVPVFNNVPENLRKLLHHQYDSNKP